MKALVIGGTSAIGEGIIKQLIANQFTVEFTYNSNSDKADTLCAAMGAQCTAKQLNLADAQAVNAFTAALTSADTPDVLINVAGITHDALSLGDVGAALAHVHTVNFLSPATICSKVAQLMMEKRQGSIINISSIAAKFPRPGNAAYGSAKAALERFTATLTLEIARFKVRTLCIAPAFVDTPMFQQFAQGREKEILKTLPLREVLKVEDVANTAMAFIRGDIKTTGITLALTNGQPVL
ncbi:SDR family NAD(P)-dependent oxidoreductase [Pseudoalteromonas tunicata]|uniref:SDR family NAD(P)-dependent oxidoreductase n=1 Tax=Pseudoalteromonas tunicata TaxID=314281 RepID=UPI00273F6C18|nr:SDR family oxidoreductase [Pseudoalteromonas tunicata]MDP5212329.1 SDR family NAD(P)-dependent oxidoreductase [Pseudoalteromonas tunicata]